MGRYPMPSAVDPDAKGRERSGQYDRVRITGSMDRARLPVMWTMPAR